MRWVFTSAPSMLQHLSHFNTVAQDVYILRTVSKSLGGGIISSREYLDIVGSYIHHGVHMVCGKLQARLSMSHSIPAWSHSHAATGVDYSYPVDDKYVRGWNHCSGLLCCPVPGYASTTTPQAIVQTFIIIINWQLLWVIDRRHPCVVVSQTVFGLTCLSPHIQTC